MRELVCWLSIMMLYTMFYPATSISQSENATTAFDYDADISEIAINLSNYHWELRNQELAKVPPNMTGAQIHFNLAGMTVDQISEMVIGTNLSEENKQKLMESGPGNCIIKPDANVKCLS